MGDSKRDVDHRLKAVTIYVKHNPGCECIDIIRHMEACKSLHRKDVYDAVRRMRSLQLIREELEGHKLRIFLTGGPPCP